jgi:predicted HAD superfamily phosphohydrolase
MFFTDWEGPWILTDFALELSMAVFNNERFFRNLSLYDDYLAYEVKREGYEAGYTLKLLAPFLLAAEVTDEEMRKIAELTARFVPDAKKAMMKLQKNWTPIVISTSYLQYLEETASMIGIEGHLHGTEVDFESIRLSESTKRNLLALIDEIASLRGERLYRKLDEVFAMKDVAEVLESVKAIGAGEKAEIVRAYCESRNVEFPVVVGDSISDYKMFDVARDLGGVAVAFNGNEYALKHADVAIVSSTAMSEAAVIELFLTEGDRAYSKLSNLDLPETEIYIIVDSDFKTVLEKSKRMRVKLRGLAGELG